MRIKNSFFYRSIVFTLLFVCFSQVLFSNSLVLNDTIYHVNSSKLNNLKNIKLKTTVVKSEFNYDYLDKKYALSKVLNDTLAKAQKLMEDIEQTKSYIDKLDAEKLVSLPVGIKKEVGGMTTIIGISKAKFFSEYAELQVYVRLSLPQQGADGKQKKLFFGANNLKLSYKGGIYGDTNISLLGDIPIPIQGGNAMVLLKGGFDMKTGIVDDKTYVKIDCNGFKELGISADILFSRKMMEPLDTNYNVISNQDAKVTGHFKTIASDWNDILAEVSLPPFQLTNKNSKDGSGKGGFVFELNKAVLDFSDKKNVSGINFPKEYNKYLVPGNEELWRGVYVKSLKVILPEFFKKKNSESRITFGASDLFVDGMGVSGKFSVSKGLISLNEGSASGWQYSLDSIHATIVTNKLTEAGFKGGIILPVSKQVDTKDINKSKKVSKTIINYSALISPKNNEYTLSLGAIDEIDFSFLKAEAKLVANSTIELKIKDKKFRPKAILHGSLNIKASNGEVKKGNKELVNFNGITFQNLQLQTEMPYFKVDEIGYKGKVNFANFPVTISNPSIASNGENISLKFKLDINMMKKAFTGGTELEIVSKLDSRNGLQRWKFDKINVGGINVEAKLNDELSFSGEVQLKDNDPVYGNGFYGELEATFGKVNVKATSWFGKTKMRYWYVDAYADLTKLKTKPTIGPMIINGIGGGAYYHMSNKQQDTKNIYNGEPIKTPLSSSGVNYVPDENTSLGFRAMIGFEFANERVLNGKLGFEMSFTSSGGLAEILFFGESHTMKAIDFKFGDKFKNRLKKMNSKINEMENGSFAKNLKKTNLLEFSKKTYPKDGMTFDAGIDSFFAMKMNNEDKSFHANLEVYVNTPGNIIRGTMDPENGKAGSAIFHIDRDTWYFHMGSPEKRVGIGVGIGSFRIKIDSYLMMGHKIPPFPKIDQKILNSIGSKLGSLEQNRDLEMMSTGKGFAFGSSLEISTGDINFLIFYANFSAGMGFDIMLKDYGETACKKTGPIGINGWYAQGQAYAYFSGDIGMRIKLWFVNKKISIIKVGAGVLLQAKLPNPSWFRGYVGGHYSVLGGLVSGRCNFKVELGQQCEVVGGGPLGGIKIISELTPNDGSTDVDVFAAPQVTFNMKINKEFNLENHKGVQTYKVLLDEFNIIHKGKPIKGEVEWDTKDVANFNSFEILPPESNLKARVKVSFQEKINGSWVTIKTNGKKAQEIKEISFKTGKAPDHIRLQDIEYCYPVVKQSYLYKDESRVGYIKLRKGRSDLFSPQTEWKQKVKFISELDTINEDVVYNANKKQINFNLEKLQKKSNYKLKIVSQIPPSNTEKKKNKVVITELNTGEKNSGTTIGVKTNKAQDVVNSIGEKEIISYDFKTSEYNTFAEKIDSRKGYNYAVDFVSDFVETLYLESLSQEAFDEIELKGGRYSANKKMIEVEAVLDDFYYKERIFKLVYKDYPIRNIIKVDRDTKLLGIPPKRAITLLGGYVEILNSSPESQRLKTVIPYSYNLPFYYYKDFKEIRNKLANEYNFGDRSSYNYILNARFPVISYGNYKVKMQYILPGNIKGTETKLIYKKINK